MVVAPNRATKAPASLKSPPQIAYPMGLAIVGRTRNAANRCSPLGRGQSGYFKGSPLLSTAVPQRLPPPLMMSQGSKTPGSLPLCPASALSGGGCTHKYAHARACTDTLTGALTHTHTRVRAHAQSGHLQCALPGGCESCQQRALNVTVRLLLSGQNSPPPGGWVGIGMGGWVGPKFQHFGPPGTPPPWGAGALFGGFGFLQGSEIGLNFSPFFS